MQKPFRSPPYMHRICSTGAVFAPQFPFLHSESTLHARQQVSMAGVPLWGGLTRLRQITVWEWLPPSTGEINSLLKKKKNMLLYVECGQGHLVLCLQQQSALGQPWYHCFSGAHLAESAQSFWRQRTRCHSWWYPKLLDPEKSNWAKNIISKSNQCCFCPQPTSETRME